MSEWYEIIIEVSHIGVIIALSYLGNFLGATFVFLFWIYYHRKIVINLFLNNFQGSVRIKL